MNIATLAIGCSPNLESLHLARSLFIARTVALLLPAEVCHSAKAAVSAPAIGVHKPVSRSNPTQVVPTCKIADSSEGPFSSAVAL
jgi:hypothetical protein